ncbi:TIGR04086 family membrane protein [Allobacillus salarius]|uniref:TIGR04086 family membrane protein n=2 Tax=Bacillaceae TaxID=186817 RepID=A0A556PTW4_9BACI|nr:TIGR04086 family membrane protein [Allobacillus salarius]
METCIIYSNSLFRGGTKMNNRLRGILYGIATILVLMFLCSLVIAMFVKFTEFSSATLTWTTFVVSILVLMIGGFIAGRKTLHKGWLTGLLTGAIYVFGVMLYQFLAYDYWLADRQATYFLIFLIAAITGSMFGVNFSKNER